MNKIIFLLLLACSFLVQGQDLIITESNYQKEIDLGEFIYESRTDGEFPNSYKKLESKELDHDYVTNSLWFKFTIDNQTNHELKRIIYFTSGLMGELEFYRITPLETKLLEVYNLKGAKKKTGIFPKLSININPNERNIYLIKRNSIHRLTSKVLLTQDSLLRVKESKYQSFYSFYFGIVSIIFIYSLCIFLIYRKNDFLFYSGFVFMVGMTMLTISGYVEGVLFSSSANRFLGLFSSGSIMTMMLFCYSFLNLEKYIPRAKYMMRMTVSISLFAMLTCLTPIYKLYSPLLGHLIDFNILVSVISIIIFSTRMVFISNEIFPKIYMSSWIIMFGATFIWYGVLFNFIPINFFTTNFIIIGNIFEILILSTALALKLKVIRNEGIIDKEKAQEREKYMKLVRVLSHDIANSLFIIRGYLRKFKRTEDSELKNKSIEKIDKASLHIKDILDNVKAEQALNKTKSGVKISSICLIKSIRDTLEFYEDRAFDKEINFKIKYEFEELFVQGNHAIITNHIFGNIISNAIKFSHSKSNIDISIKQIDGHIVTSFRDYGQGISKPELGKIQKQEDISSTVGTNGEGGTGFGLFLIRSYTLFLKGLFNIQSFKNCELGNPDGTLVEISFKN
ncbi:hypothetical protein A9Q84_10175 [Halobacteriovorax marinus]|uniref:Histidine kinase domain-containing protein n=1 Tax=Halobacteriovorax marinus TaxID=97084 RepID=A0A1Y5FCX4_9BACT|nr:hypothetical protein A9Q84_10175 [Halobacteriovorax marinus]